MAKADLTSTTVAQCSAFEEAQGQGAGQPEGRTQDDNLRAQMTGRGD